MLSIIIPARNDAEMTETCLKTATFSASKLKLACEFILIDDASAESEGILDVFKRCRAGSPPHQFKIVRSRKHQHYTGAFSIGLHFATRELIFFLSNDMLLTPSFLEALLMVSALSPQFGIVRGTSNYVDSHIEHTVQPPGPLHSFAEIEAFSRSILENNGCIHVEDQVLSGDAILIKRAVVDKIGVLDLRFFGYYGDIDYGMRAHLAGFKLVCAKGAWLLHEGSGHVRREMLLNDESDTDKARLRRLALVDNAYQQFRAKWSPELPPAYSPDWSLHYFSLARANAERVPLKCELPATVLNELEFY